MNEYPKELETKECFLCGSSAIVQIIKDSNRKYAYCKKCKLDEE